MTYFELLDYLNEKGWKYKVDRDVKNLLVNGILEVNQFGEVKILLTYWQGYNTRVIELLITVLQHAKRIASEGVTENE